MTSSRRDADGTWATRVQYDRSSQWTAHSTWHCFDPLADDFDPVLWRLEVQDTTGDGLHGGVNSGGAAPEEESVHAAGAVEADVAVGNDAAGDDGAVAVDAGDDPDRGGGSARNNARAKRRRRR